jgi:hypothetical protein
MTFDGFLGSISLVDPTEFEGVPCWNDNVVQAYHCEQVRYQTIDPNVAGPHCGRDGKRSTRWAG